MSTPASLLDHWYALGPEDKPFRSDDPDWNVHRIVEDVPGLPDVCVENAAGQRFLLARDIATAIALPPSHLERPIPSHEVRAQGRARTASLPSRR